MGFYNNPVPPFVYTCWGTRFVIYDAHIYGSHTFPLVAKFDRACLWDETLHGNIQVWDTPSFDKAPLEKLRQIKDASNQSKDASN